MFKYLILHLNSLRQHNSMICYGILIFSPGIDTQWFPFSRQVNRDKERFTSYSNLNLKVYLITVEFEL